MKIVSAEFICSAVKKGQYPEDNMPEIAFAGRSNGGKSSLLNLLTNRKKLAKVSASPGKTRTINFFNINNAFRIVDLPGYGYARVSREAKESFSKLADDYFTCGRNISLVLNLIDIRHEPSSNDKMMYDWITHNGYEPIIIATKLDKINRSQKDKHIKMLREAIIIFTKANR